MLWMPIFIMIWPQPCAVSEKDVFEAVLVLAGVSTVDPNPVLLCRRTPRMSLARGRRKNEKGQPTQGKWTRQGPTPLLGRIGDFLKWTASPVNSPLRERADLDYTQGARGRTSPKWAPSGFGRELKTVS